jgi:light-regulated signal transduction histidine kinase (bacteriophytochrome)
VEQNLFTRMQSLNKLVSMLPSLGELSPTQAEAVNRISDLNHDIFDVLDDLQAQNSNRPAAQNGTPTPAAPANGTQVLQAVAGVAPTQTETPTSPREQKLAELQNASLQNQPIQFRHLLQTAINQHASAANNKQIKIQLEISPSIPQYLGDAEQFAQAVSEMLDNAIKYCPEGAKVRVIAGVDNKNLIIAVRDNGKGVWLKDIPLLFDPYFRVNNVQTHSQPGEGLGLTIVKAVAENHGGRALVESRVGRGTIFFMKLPLDT